MDWYLQINFQHITSQVHIDQEQFLSSSLNFAVFVGRSSDFFEIAAKVIMFGFVVDNVFDVVIAVNDEDISDAAVVIVGLNSLLVPVVLFLGQIK